MTKTTRRKDSTVQPDAAPLLSVVQTMYASALLGTSEIWNTIYQQCSLLLEGEAGGFISTDKIHNAADIASLIGFDQDKAIQAYNQYGVESDLLFTSTLDMGAGATFLSTEKIGFRELQRSPFFDILAAPERLRYVLGGILENDEHRHSAMYFWRRDDQPDFDRASQSALVALIPHVRQALEVQRRVRGPQAGLAPAGAPALAAVESSRHGILVLDETGRVLLANPEAERIARSGNGISVQNGFFLIDDARVAGEIRRMMARALGIARHAELAHMKPIPVPCRHGGRPYEVLVIPVTDGAQRAVLPPTAAFMVTITDPAAVAGLDHQWQSDYGLTSAEARMCQALVITGSLADAADRLSISRNTARTHLKRIFGKVGVTSQLQLVMRLAAAGPPVEGYW